MDAKLRVTWFSWMMMVPFLWFIMLARRTFMIPSNGGPGMILGGVALMSGLALAFWIAQHGAYSQALWAVGAALAICSVVLYESARRVVTGRGFFVALSGAVPDAVCTVGPYRYIRHPVYTSYLLALPGDRGCIPGLPSAASVRRESGVLRFRGRLRRAHDCTRPLAQAYASYRQGAGMFVPRLGRASRV